MIGLLLGPEPGALQPLLRKNRQKNRRRPASAFPHTSAGMPTNERPEGHALVMPPVMHPGPPSPSQPDRFIKQPHHPLPAGETDADDNLLVSLFP